MPWESTGAPQEGSSDHRSTQQGHALRTVPDSAAGPCPDSLDGRQRRGIRDGAGGLWERVVIWAHVGLQDLTPSDLAPNLLPKSAIHVPAMAGGPVNKCVNGGQAAVLSACSFPSRFTLPVRIICPSLHRTPEATRGSTSGAFSFRQACSATRSIFQIMAWAPSTRL